MAQPDTHPDADLLNAFVEHALSGTERAQIVSHMAGCARCREVVYLAHAAAGLENAPETAQEAAVRKPEPVPGRLTAIFSRWRVALIPAAALAAVGGVALWVQLHPAPRSTEMAQLSSPRLESPVVIAPQSSQQPPLAADRKAAVAAQVNSFPAAKPAPPERPSATAQKKATAPARTGSFPALAGLAGAIRPPAEIHHDGRSAALARSRAPQSAAAFPPFSDMTAQQRQMVRGTPDADALSSAVLAPRSAAMIPVPAPQQSRTVAVQNEIAIAPVNGLSQVSTQSLQETELVSPPVNGLPVLRLAKRAKLPSGLNTVSSAVLLNRLVAVDSAGSVFLSQDGGRRWDPVFAQWTGKAVEVQAPSQGLYRMMAASDDRSREPSATAQASLNTSPSDSTKDAPAPPPAPSPMSSGPALAAKAKAALPRPAVLFKLVTDRHEVWVSSDGKIWREQ